MVSWSGALTSILEKTGNFDAFPCQKRFIAGANTYLVRSYDGSALQFSFPAQVKFDILEDYPEALPGSDGAIGALIEEIKLSSSGDSGLRAIGGLDTSRPGDYSYNIEPVTFCRSSFGAGQRLWKADSENFYENGYASVRLSGALPFPGDPLPGNLVKVEESFSTLLESVAGVASLIGGRVIEESALLSLDQKYLRQNLDTMGLVSFVADGTRSVRDYTSHRGHFRIAGPNQRSNIPFQCPEGLSPVELDLPASGGSVTGLGIRKKELFAVTGSNAEGKTTFLQAVRSGVDDHLPGDGREYLVTSGKVMTAEAGDLNMSGSDISMFFSSLPPGISGKPEYAYGRGSGSMVMAAQLGEAVRKKASMIVIDEDRSATNLLVPNCLQGENVTPLSVICRERRDELGDCAVLFAAATMDLLVAEADRIMEFRDHNAKMIDRNEFRRLLKIHLESVLENL